MVRLCEITLIPGARPKPVDPDRVNCLITVGNPQPNKLWRLSHRLPSDSHRMSNPETDNNSLNKPDRENAIALPHLRLQHFFLWMLCTGLYVTIIRWIMAAERSVHGLGDTHVLISQLSLAMVIGSTINGLVLTALLVLVGNWCRGNGQKLLRAPGHWIVLVMSLAVMIDLAGRLTLLCIAAFDGNPVSIEVHNMMIMSLGLLALLFYALGAANVSVLIWRIPLAFMAFLAFADLAYILNANYLLLPIEYLWVPMGRISVAVLAMVALAALYELAARVRTDWIHKAGVTAYVMIGLLQWGILSLLQ